MQLGRFASSAVGAESCSAAELLVIAATTLPWSHDAVKALSQGGGLRAFLGCIRVEPRIRGGEVRPDKQLRAGLAVRQPREAVCQIPNKSWLCSICQQQRTQPPSYNGGWPDQSNDRFIYQLRVIPQANGAFHAVRLVR